MNDMTKVKVGVLGTGALGRHHARLYAQNPRAEVVGIFDVNAESAAKVGAEFGLKVFTDRQELAAQCDALSVAVPATGHAETALPLIQAGKHLLLEKPLAASVFEGEALVNAARAAGTVLAVGHVERFNPAVEYLDKYAGRICFIEAHRMSPYPPSRPGMPPRGTEVSVVLDLMIHDIDLALHLIKSEVTDIDVVGMPVLSGCEDIVNARIKFANGGCANLSASRMSQTPKRRFRVLQPEGYLSMDLNDHTGTMMMRRGNDIRRENIILEDKNALAAELDDFLAAVQATRADGKVHPARIPGEAGLKALRLAAAIETEARRYNRQFEFPVIMSRLG